MRRLMKAIGSAVALIAMSASGALAVDATLPDPNYPGGRALTYMIKVVAEQRLGLEIGIERTNAVPVIWKAMDRGKGEIDVLARGVDAEPAGTGRRVREREGHRQAGIQTLLGQPRPVRGPG